MQKKLTRKQALRRRRIFLTVCTAVALAVVTAVVALVVHIAGLITESGGVQTPSSSTLQSGEATSSDSAEPYKVSTATVINAGDILVHNPVLAGAYNSSTGEYDFSEPFRYTEKYFNAAQLAVINLEATLGGEKSGAYKGYPAFNTPDSLVDSIINAGIGMCLTSNNHSYDTGFFGMVRTVQVLKEKGIPYIGTRETDTEPRYIIKDVNGIKLGMANFTYENKCDTAGRKSLNGNILKQEANALINSFAYERIDEFYSDAQAMIAEMKAKGADAVVFYMHWGEEYQLSPNQWQRTIAQRLCDLGVDVIVGGHPHVVQPMQTLYASGSDRTSVCIYSMGNYVSNQRTEELDNAGHTEDGVMFSFTFEKYSDKTTVLTAVDAIPIWVNKVGARYNAKYTVIPLETSNAGAQFGLDSAACKKAAASYERTRAIIAQSLAECQSGLGCETRAWS